MQQATKVLSTDEQDGAQEPDSEVARRSEVASEVARRERERERKAAADAVAARDVVFCAERDAAVMAEDRRWAA